MVKQLPRLGTLDAHARQPSVVGRRKLDAPRPAKHDQQVPESRHRRSMMMRPVARRRDRLRDGCSALRRADADVVAAVVGTLGEDARQRRRLPHRVAPVVAALLPRRVWVHALGPLRVWAGVSQRDPRVGRDGLVDLHGRLVEARVHQRSSSSSSSSAASSSGCGTARLGGSGRRRSSDRDALAVRDPRVLGVRVVRHVDLRQDGRVLEVRVQREQHPAHKRRALEKRQQLRQEVARVAVGGVRVRLLRCVEPRQGRGRGARRVVVHDDFVDGEDGEGAGDARDGREALFGGGEAVVVRCVSIL